MKPKVLLMVVLAVVAALATMSTAVAAPALHGAMGGGSAIHEGGVGSVDIAFTAQQVDESGSAKGQVVFQSHVGTTSDRVKFGVLYLVVDNGTAWMGLVVTQSDIEWVDMGSEFIWAVQDNGEGNKASGPDMFSGFWEAPATDALSQPALNLEGYWANGNVQVR